MKVVLDTASLAAVGESIGEAIRAGYAAAGLGEASCWENLPTSQQGPQQIHKYTFRPTIHHLIHLIEGILQSKEDDFFKN